MNFNLNELNESKLDQLGIFQLRSIAREVGVHLPTTLKKQELISQILKVVNGEISPFVPKNKKGRPPKVIIGAESVWSTQEASADVKQEESHSWIKGKWIDGQNQFIASTKVCSPKILNYDSSNSTEFYGILFREPNGNGTVHIGGISELNKNNLAFISKDLIVQYNLRTGDDLKGYYISSNSRNEVVKLISINNEIAECKGRIDFSNLTSIPSKNKVDLSIISSLKQLDSQCPIGKGQRVLVQGPKGSGKTSILNNLAESFALNNISTILVDLDKRPEDKNVSINSNIEYCFASFDVVPFRQMYMLELAATKAKRLCEQGKSVALLVNDLFAVARAYNACVLEHIDSGFMGLDMSAVIAVKKLLAVGRNTEEGGSVTFVACINNDVDENTKRFIMQLDDVCNCHIILTKDGEISSLSNTENKNQLN